MRRFQQLTKWRQLSQDVQESTAECAEETSNKQGYGRETRRMSLIKILVLRYNNLYTLSYISHTSTN